MARLNYILIMALTILTACTSDDAMQQDAGVAGPAVKAQFTLAIPNLYGAQTRMAGADVNNETSDFSGMADMRIFPFVSASQTDGEYLVTGNTAFSGHTAVSHQFDDNRLPDFGKDALLHKDVANDKWYADLSIPAGTNAMLIYGKAFYNENAEANEDEKATLRYTHGATDATYDMKTDTDTPEKISFSPVPLYNSTTPLCNSVEAQLLVQLLNNVISAEGYETADGSLECWANDDNLLTATYNDFITMRAGNSIHILNVLETLYNACSQTTALDLLSAPAGQKTMPKAIQEAITTKVTIADKSIQLSATETDAGTHTLSWSTSGGSADPNFPACYQIPDGAVQLTYTVAAEQHKPGTFAYSTTASQYGSYSLDYTKLTYPAELYYRANTSIRTSDTEQDANVGTKKWGEFISSCYAPTALSVEATTKSIAAVKPMQYAVGRLDSYIHIEPGTIYARDPKAPTDDKKQVAVTIPANGLRITGLLIGSQPSKVGWAFKPTDDSETRTIYDRVMTTMTGATASTVGTSETYAQQSVSQSQTPFSRTLVYESKGVNNPASPVEVNTNDEKVNIAIEFENNTTQAFYGQDGLIPVGGRFYLISTITLSDNVIEANANGYRSIFIQDHITEVNATVHSLKQAYSTIPNLTVPAQELGISIDLRWKNGAVIDSTIK